MFPTATLYDEGTLLWALLHGQTPEPRPWGRDDDLEACSIVEGGGAPRPVIGGLALPPADARLRPNPLLTHDRVHWPSDRWRDEYGPTCFWAMPEPVPDPVQSIDPVRPRRVVELPERW